MCNMVSATLSNTVVTKTESTMLKRASFFKYANDIVCVTRPCIIAYIFLPSDSHDGLLMFNRSYQAAEVSPASSSKIVQKER